LHVYYAGNESLHGDLFNTKQSGPRKLKARGERLSRQSSSLPNYSALCRATWKTGRLWALAPVIGGPYVGTATTTARNLVGKQLHVNLVTRPKGELRVAVLDGGGNVLPGFSAADCLPISGDLDNVAVKWKTEKPLPATARRYRFHLKRAFLYGFSAK